MRLMSKLQKLGKSLSKKSSTVKGAEESYTVIPNPFILKGPYLRCLG